MKHICIAIFLLSITPQDKQQECENICLECQQQEESDNSFCMNIYRSCCKLSGGKVQEGCGCRVGL
jgi:hypothetical protein